MTSPKAPLTQREPAQLTGGALSALVFAVLGLLGLFGVITPDGTGDYVVTILTIALPYLTSLAVRLRVWSPAKVESEMGAVEGMAWSAGYEGGNYDAAANAQLIRELQAKVDELTAKEAA